jgi:hypothetical protein
VPSRRRRLLTRPLLRAHAEHVLGDGRDERQRAVSGSACQRRHRGLPNRRGRLQLGAGALGGGDEPRVLGGRASAVESLRVRRRAARCQHAERRLRSAPARRQPAPDAADVGSLDHRRVRARGGRGVSVRPRARHVGARGGGDERGVLAQWVVLPLQQQRLVSLVCLPAVAVPAGRAHSAHTPARARVRAGRCRRGKHLRGHARGVRRHHRQRGRLRDRAPRPGAAARAARDLSA